MFALNDRESFEHAGDLAKRIIRFKETLRNESLEINDEPEHPILIPLVFNGNKCDLTDDREVHPFCMLL